MNINILKNLTPISYHYLYYHHQGIHIGGMGGIGGIDGIGGTGGMGGIGGTGGLAWHGWHWWTESWAW